MVETKKATESACSNLSVNVTAQWLHRPTPNLALGWHTFVPEDFGVPGQQSL